MTDNRAERRCLAYYQSDTKETAGEKSHRAELFELARQGDEGARELLRTKYKITAVWDKELQKLIKI